MKKNYQTPFLSVEQVKVEEGFTISYGAGTPGGDIGYGDYGEEL